LKKSISTLFILVILFTVNIVHAQINNLGSWNQFNVKYNLNEKWSAFGEIQLRSLGFYNNFHYTEFKAGISLKVHPNTTLTLAGGDYDTYKEGGDFVLPKNNDEFRLWPQLALQQSLGKLKIEQRYRSEFRFTNKGYRNRFRYRLGVSYPFGKDKKGFQPFQLNASNELFFTDKEPYFERNRLSLSLNYKVSKEIMFQLGHVHQFDYKINDETGRDFLQLGLFIELFHQ
jgi:long-subunit fatty acid transport protein